MPLDDKDLEQIAKLIAAAQTKAAEEADKRLEATIGKAIKAAGVETTKQLEALKAETEKRFGEIPKPADPPDPKAGDKPGDIENSPAFKKLQAEVEASKKQAAEQAKRAEQAEAKRSAELLTNATRDALIASGADPKRVHLALPVLQASGRIKLDDKGAPVMVFQRNGYEEALPVGDGAKEWLGTDDGKVFVPPSGKQGTGDGVQRGGASQSGSAPRNKDGSLDWSQLAGRINLAPLEGASDS